MLRAPFSRRRTSYKKPSGPPGAFCMADTEGAGRPRAYVIMHEWGQLGRRHRISDLPTDLLPFKRDRAGGVPHLAFVPSPRRSENDTEYSPKCNSRLGNYLIHIFIIALTSPRPHLYGQAKTDTTLASLYRRLFIRDSIPAHIFA